MGKKKSFRNDENTTAKNAEEIIVLIPVEAGINMDDNYLLNEETTMDTLAIDENADAITQKSTKNATMEEVKKILEEKQVLARSGREELKETLDTHHAVSPTLSGGDIDANWAAANSTGEETVGGENPTPDQDVVGDLGKAVGLTYQDDEPLASASKLEERDENRWELNPMSAEEDKA